MSGYLYPCLYYFTYVFIHVFFTLARLRSAILNIGFDEICTPISKLSFVAISNSKILKPKELTSQVSILLRLILLVSENRKYFEIFVNTHRWSTYVFIHVFFTLARLRSAILNIGFDEICTPISKLSFVAISNSKILKPKELTSQVSILLRLILLVSENRKYFEIFVNTHR